MLCRWHLTMWLLGRVSVGALCEKKDAEVMRALLEPYRPYRSLVCWYMWRVLESKPYDEAMS